jgi:hypothetical protein
MPLRLRLPALLGVFGLALSGCGASTKSDDGQAAAKSAGASGAAGRVFADPRFPFTFSYPKDWGSGNFTYDASRTAGAEPAASAAIGIDADNSVLLTRYNLSPAVASLALRDQLPELNSVISRFAGRPYYGQITEVGGHPAVRYEAFVLADDAARRNSRVIYLYEGAAQYELNCQFTPDKRETMSSGCDQMVSTLRMR